MVARTLALAVVVACMCCGSALGAGDLLRKREVVIVAHRGVSSEAPENTLAAFRRAIEQEADYFELDCCLTKDGHVVVIHDDTVNRTTNGHGLVREMTLAEIKKLDAGSWRHEKFADERIPTLGESLDVAKGKIGVYIEIKPPIYHNEGIVPKVVKAIEERDMAGEVVIQSFEHLYVKEAKELNPNIRTETLTDGGPVDAAQVAETALAEGYNTNMDYLTKERVNQLHAAGKTIAIYTLNWPDHILHALDCGVDVIITDKPKVVIQTLAKRKKDS